MVKIILKVAKKRKIAEDKIYTFQVKFVIKFNLRMSKKRECKKQQRIALKISQIFKLNSEKKKRTTGRQKKDKKSLEIKIRIQFSVIG